MKNYILDTQTFIKAFQSPEELTKKVQQLIQNDRVVKYVSVVTFWEMAYLADKNSKIFTVKTPLAQLINQAISQLQVVVLNLSPEHAQRFYELQPVKDHPDGFDRMLIAQAVSTGFTMVSTDRNFSKYKMMSLFENEN